MAEYYHTEHRERHASVQKVPYQGREVLVREHDGDNEIWPHVCVLGFINRRYMESRKGRDLSVTKFDPIVDERQKTEIKNLLRERGEKREINFRSG